MKTLVIHPSDPSTDFLRQIYINESYDKLITENISNSQLVEDLQSHDRIIMLGHGYPGGLFGFRGQVIINSSHVQFLRDKPENIYIWCNADQFVEKYDLKGFYSGMFISENEEAYHCNVPYKLNDVSESNNLFAKVLGENIKLSAPELITEVKKQYSPVTEVIKYNSERLYQR